MFPIYHLLRCLCPDYLSNVYLLTSLHISAARKFDVHLSNQTYALGLIALGMLIKHNNLE